jgi:hypothetical protein
MSRIMGRLIIWVADALERSLIMVPDLDEADTAHLGPCPGDRADWGAPR